MKVVVLGTAGYHPNENRQTTCVVIPEAGLVFDAGTAMFRLPRYLTTSSIDLFLSHAHLDHVVGLTYLLDVVREHPLREVRVHGEADKLNAVREQLFSAALFPVEPPFVSLPMTAPVQLADGGVVSHHALKHPGGSVGYRVDWPDRSLAYITDTTADPAADYVDFIRDASLLIHECNFDDGHEELAAATGHSCLTPVVEVARQANVQRLVLIHFNPLVTSPRPVDVEKVRGSFPPIVLADDGLEVEF